MIRFNPLYVTAKCCDSLCLVLNTFICLERKLQVTRPSLWVCRPWLSGASPSPVVSVSPSPSAHSCALSSQLLFHHPGRASPHISSHHRLEEDSWWGFLGGSDGKECTCNVGDQGLIPGLGRSLEKEMATHSSIFAWEIPWTEEPGRLSMGSQRVGLDWATNTVSGSSHHQLCVAPCACPLFTPSPCYLGPLAPSLPPWSAGLLTCHSCPVWHTPWEGMHSSHTMGAHTSLATRNRDPTLSWILACDVFTLFASES